MFYWISGLPLYVYLCPLLEIATDLLTIYSLWNAACLLRVGVLYLKIKVVFASSSDFKELYKLRQECVTTKLWDKRTGMNGPRDQQTFCFQCASCFELWENELGKDHEYHYTDYYILRNSSDLLLFRSASILIIESPSCGYIVFANRYWRQPWITVATQPRRTDHGNYLAAAETATAAAQWQGRFGNAIIRSIRWLWMLFAGSPFIHLRIVISTEKYLQLTCR